MAFEKLRPIVITATPKPRIPRKVQQDWRNFPNTRGRAAKQGRPGGGKIGQ
jgi:hypothetical protein